MSMATAEEVTLGNSTVTEMLWRWTVYAEYEVPRLVKYD